MKILQYEPGSLCRLIHVSCFVSMLQGMYMIVYAVGTWHAYAIYASVRIASDISFTIPEPYGSLAILNDLAIQWQVIGQVVHDLIGIKEDKSLPEEHMIESPGCFCQKLETKNQVKDLQSFELWKLLEKHTYVSLCGWSGCHSVFVWVLPGVFVSSFRRHCMSWKWNDQYLF